jgi:hypothetical protein
VGDEPRKLIAIRLDPKVWRRLRKTAEKKLTLVGLHPLVSKASFRPGLNPQLTPIYDNHILSDMSEVLRKITGFEWDDGNSAKNEANMV